MIEITDSVIERAVIVLDALNNKTRTQIIRVLLNNITMDLQEMKRELPSVSQNSLVNHLTLLRQAKLVTYEVEKRSVTRLPGAKWPGEKRYFIYMANIDHLRSVMRCANVLASISPGDLISNNK